MSQKSTRNSSGVSPELAELAERVEKAELQARLLEAQVKIMESKDRLQKLHSRAKSAEG